MEHVLQSIYSDDNLKQDTNNNFLKILVYFYLFSTCPFSLIVTVFCCGSTSFILNDLILLVLCWFRLADAGKLLTVGCLCSCYILSVFSVAILMIPLIFSTMPMFVFSSNTNIFDSAFINLFLSM